MGKNILDNLVVILDEHYASDLDVFAQVIKTPAIQPLVKASYYDAIAAREREYPTGICGPVVDFAIPHTDPEHIIDPFVAVVRPLAPVTFKPMGMAETDAQAKLIIMLGIQKGGQQIEFLQKLMTFFMDEAAVEEILAEQNLEVIREKMKVVLS